MSTLKMHFRFLLPKLLAITLVLVSSVPISIPGMAYFFPQVEVMLIFYFCIWQPRSLPSWFVFLLGIFRDALSGTSLGIHALINIMLRSSVLMIRDRYIKMPFYLVWKIFFVFCTAIVAIKWILYCVVFDQIMPVNMLLMQWIMTIVCYPLFHLLFTLSYHAKPSDIVDA